jgi:hypothetical protein
MPCSGPRGPFLRRSLSSARASFIALGLSRITALMAGPLLSYASMRSRYICTRSCDVMVPDASAACVSRMLASMNRNGTSPVCFAATTVVAPCHTTEPVVAATKANANAKLRSLARRTGTGGLAGIASLLVSGNHRRGGNQADVAARSAPDYSGRRRRLHAVFYGSARIFTTCYSTAPLERREMSCGGPQF